MYRAYKENFPVKQGDAGHSKQRPPHRNNSADGFGQNGPAPIANQKGPLSNIESKPVSPEHQTDAQTMLLEHMVES